MMPLRYLGNVALALLFTGMYVLCYTLFLAVYFDYDGVVLYPRELSFVAFTVLIAVLPIVMYRGFRAFSSAVAVFIYALLYVPITVTFALGSPLPVVEIVGIQVTFMLSMCLIFLADSIILRSPVDFHGHVALEPYCLALTVATTLYILFVYRGNLRFASFGQEVYTQRASAAELGTGLVARYLSSWLATVLTPVCLAHGLVARKVRYFLAGAVACVAMYMATAAKWMILLPFVYGASYVLFSHGRLRSVLALFILSVSALMAILLATVRNVEGILFMAASILMSRTIANAGQLTMAYYSFFSSHPHTDYAHINLVNMLFDSYPYGPNQVGQVVGQYFWSADMNANANFWATDGIAAAGLAGVPVASLAVALLFLCINSATRGYNQLFVLLCFIPFIVMLLNASLFSAAFSGGALLLMLFFLFNKRAPVSGTAP